jgi:hypothetical protein
VRGTGTVDALGEDVTWIPRSEAAHSSASPRELAISGVSSSAVGAFCDALEFIVYGQPATAEEMAALDRALTRVSEEALAAGVTPERMLIGLKKAWTTICNRLAAADVFDPLWQKVVDVALTAYEAHRAQQSR